MRSLLLILMVAFSTGIKAQVVENFYYTSDSDVVALNLPAHNVETWAGNKVMIVQTISYIGQKRIFAGLVKSGRYDLIVTDTISLATPKLGKAERRVITVYMPE